MEQVKTALETSFCSVTVSIANQIVGMGRVVGDGSVYFYIQDVIVHPDYRGQGIGRDIVIHLLEQIRSVATGNCFVGLMAAVGTVDFYEKLGFKKRDDKSPGMFLRVND